MNVYIYDKVLEELEHQVGAVPLFGVHHDQSMVVLSRTAAANLVQVGIGVQDVRALAEPLTRGERVVVRSVKGAPEVVVLADGKLVEGCKVEVFGLHRDILARANGIVECREFDGLCVGFLGTGSVATLMARALVQAGVTKLVAVDDGRVSVPNVSRYAFGLEAVGLPKVEALRNMLMMVNPSVDVTMVNARLTLETFVEVQTALAGCDLVIIATDSVRSNLMGQEVTWRLGIPTEVVGAYERASGGEVMWCIPGRTACLHCLRAALAQPESSAAGPFDYTSASGPADLKAEPGLSVDVGLIALAATKQAIAFLAGRTGPGTALDLGMPLMLIGNEATWVFEGPFQFSRVRVLKDPDCWVCGKPPVQVAPNELEILDTADDPRHPSRKGG